MKYLSFIIIVFGLFNCKQALNDNPSNKEIALNKKNRAFFENYIKDINKANWAETITPYLREGSEDFIEDHKKFRTAYADYKASIKQMVVEGNYAMAWMKIEATHAGVYNGISLDKESQHVKPTNKRLNWEEVWYFDFDGNRFGQSWDFMSQDLVRMKQMGVTTLNRN